MNYFKLINGTISYTIMSLIFTMIVSFIIYFIIKLNIKEKKIRLIIFIGILIRIIIILTDNFYKIVSFSGADAIQFEKNAWYYAQGLNYWDFPYIKMVVGPLYKFFNIRYPIIIVLFNLLIYSLAIIFLYKTLNLINMNSRKIKKRTFAIISFSLVSALLNVSFLRETVMLFFTTLSVYFFYNDKINWNILLATIFLSISAYFHSGVIFISFGYLYYFIFKSKGKERIIKLILGLCLIILVIIFIKKMPYMDRIDLEKLSLMEIKNKGSNYVSQVSTVKGLILSTPIRCFYFLFSPTPNKWRNLIDIITFTFNSTIYIYLISNIYLKYKKVVKKLKFKEKLKIKSLIVSFIITGLVYAEGTYTSGTAIRHRDKLLLLLLVINYFLEVKSKNKFRRKIGVINKGVKNEKINKK